MRVKAVWIKSHPRLATGSAGVYATLQAVLVLADRDANL